MSVVRTSKLIGLIFYPYEIGVNKIEAKFFFVTF